MVREGELSAIFTVLLFGVVWPAGCGDPGYGECALPYLRIVDRVALAEAMRDQSLSADECVELCTHSQAYPPEVPPMPQPTTGAGETCGESSTGGAATVGTTGGGSETGGTDSDMGTDSGTSTDTDVDICTAGASPTAVDDEPDPYSDPESVHTCRPIDGGDDLITCYFTGCAYGRRPAGLRSEGRAVGARALGRWLAETAHLEAASVPAFERLAAALTEHGAPVALRERALAAAVDERRHAAQMTALAGEYGGTPAAPELDAVAPLSLLELAIDNAVEGCVGETWAALVARHQADAAKLSRVREIMAAIAADETEHAELAWSIDAWACGRLSPGERDAVAAARSTAHEALRERISGAIDHAELLAVGVPRRATALALHEGLRRALWAPALT